VQSTRCGDIKHITRPNGPEEVSSWLGDGSAILTVIACRLICGPYLQVSKTWIICWSSATLFWPKVSSIPNNCRELLVRNCHRDLGLLVTSNLHWNEHYDMLLKEAYKTLGLIRRIFQNARVVQTKKLLYLTLVRSKLQYCSPIWRPQFMNDIKNIENIQRRVTKFILNDYSSDYKSQLLKLNLPLMMQFEINDIMFLVKNLREPSQSFNVMDFCRVLLRQYQIIYIS